MEPIKDGTSNLDTLLEGVTDGSKITVDFLGALYSALTKKLTIGGSGIYSTDLDGNQSPTVNYDTLLYRTGKIAGMVMGSIFQSQLIGFPQTVLIGVNYYRYRENKAEGKEKFE